MSAILGSRQADTVSSARYRLSLTRAPVGLYAGSVAVALLLAASSLLGLAGGPSLYDESRRRWCHAAVMPPTCS